MEGISAAMAKSGYNDEANNRGGAIASAIGVAQISRSTSVSGLISQASETRNYATDRLESVQALSSRALDLATRLAGSFPAPGSERNALNSGEKIAEPSSALDALSQTIGDINRPLSAMDDAFNRLVAAFDAIERAI